MNAPSAYSVSSSTASKSARMAEATACWLKLREDQPDGSPVEFHILARDILILRLRSLAMPSTTRRA